MAHTYRNKSQANGQTGNPFTHDHTPGAAATVAILSIVVEGTTARTGGAPTIDGITASQADSTRVGLEQNVELWYVVKAFSGAQFTVSVPNTNTRTCHIEVVTADAGIGYTSFLNNANGVAWADDTNDGGTVNVTSSASGDFLYARLGCGEAAVGSVAESSANPTKTLSYANDHGAYTSFGYYAVSDGAGTESFTWTWTNDDGCICAAAFKSLVKIDVSKTDTGAVIDSKSIRLAQLVLSPIASVNLLDSFTIGLQAPPVGNLAIAMIHH